MNADDLMALRGILHRIRDVVERARPVLAFLPPGSEVESLQTLLAHLTDDVNDLTVRLQDRAARAWSRPDHPPRHPAPRRLKAPLDSREFPEGRVVPRHDVSGALKADAPSVRPISGRWNDWKRERRERCES